MKSFFALTVASLFDFLGQKGLKGLLLGVSDFFDTAIIVNVDKIITLDLKISPLAPRVRALELNKFYI